MKDRIAKKGMYRVLLVDTFDNEHCVIGDYKSLEKAKSIADSKGGTMIKCYVYDDTGKYLHQSGTY